MTGDSGYFWFFNPSNVELTVKVLNGCGLNNQWWVFISGLTNQGWTLHVRDTQTGLKLYRGAALEGVAPLLREDGFAIDVEILVAVRHAGRLSIVEAPVRIVASHHTTVSWRRALATVGGLCRVLATVGPE